MGLSRKARVIGSAIVVAALVGGLVAVVSSGPDHHAKVSLSAAPSHPAAGGKGDSLAVPGTTGTTAASAAADAPSAPSAAGAAAAASTPAAAASRPAAVTAAAAAAAAHPTPGAPALSAATKGPAATGTYRYRQTVPAASPAVEGTLVVTASTSGTQTWTRNFGSNIPTSTSVMWYNAGGIFTLGQSEQLAGTTVSCNFGSPLASPPWPPTVGRTFAGQAACTDQAALSVSGEIAGTAVVPLDGAPVSTVVVGSNLVMSVTYQGTPYEADLTQVDWYTPSLRMPIQTAIHLVIPALSITSDTTYALESSKPS